MSPAGAVHWDSLHPTLHPMNHVPSSASSYGGSRARRRRVDPREHHYIQWPYYQPPSGWVFDPSYLNSPEGTLPLWAGFRRPRRGESLPTYITESFAHPYGFAIHWSPSNGVHLGVDHVTPNDASPFYVDVSRGVQSELTDRVEKYRQAQARAVSDPDYPIVHPAFAYRSSAKRSDLAWDLARRFNTDDYMTPFVPLHTGELQTALTHPPLLRMRIRFAGAPALSIDLSCDSSECITPSALIFELFNFVSRQRMTVGEYQELPPRIRDRVTAEHQRRVGASARAPPAFGDTPYLMRDVLGDARVFAGLEMRSPTEWMLHTTTHEKAGLIAAGE